MGHNAMRHVRQLDTMRPMLQQDVHLQQLAVGTPVRFKALANAPSLAASLAVVLVLGVAVVLVSALALPSSVT